VGAARDAGVRRLVVVTGAMIGHPPEHLSWLYRFVPAHLAGEQAALLADRRLQEDLVRTSGLDWTLVRPPRLGLGHPTGRVVAGPDLDVGLLARVDRADLARYLLDVASDPAMVGQAVSVRSVRPGAGGPHRTPTSVPTRPEDGE
jgi:hypothetical protein